MLFPRVAFLTRRRMLPGTINGGTLTSASGQLALITNGGNITIGSLIVDNGGPTAVAISGTGGGRQVSLNNGNNSYSGGTYLNGSGINLNTPAGTALGTGDCVLRQRKHLHGRSWRWHPFSHVQRCDYVRASSMRRTATMFPTATSAAMVVVSGT